MRMARRSQGLLKKRLAVSASHLALSRFRCMLAGVYQTRRMRLQHIRYYDHSAALWLWRTKDLQDRACTRLTRNFSREEWSRWFPKQTYRQTCPNLPVVR